MNTTLIMNASEGRIQFVLEQEGSLACAQEWSAPSKGTPKHPRVKANYTDVFSTVMRKLGDRDERVVAITAAMTDGTGLKRFHNMFPERFFDVGIAEEHAVTFAAGLAAGGTWRFPVTW